MKQNQGKSGSSTVRGELLNEHTQPSPVVSDRASATPHTRGSPAPAEHGARVSEIPPLSVSSQAGPGVRDRFSKVGHAADLETDTDLTVYTSRADDTSVDQRALDYVRGVVAPGVYSTYTPDASSLRGSVQRYVGQTQVALGAGDEALVLFAPQHISQEAGVLWIKPAGQDTYSPSGVRVLPSAVRLNEVVKSRVVAADMHITPTGTNLNRTDRYGNMDAVCLTNLPHDVDPSDTILNTGVMHGARLAGSSLDEGLVAVPNAEYMPYTSVANGVVQYDPYAIMEGAQVASALRGAYPLPSINAGESHEIPLTFSSTATTDLGDQFRPFLAGNLLVQVPHSLILGTLAASSALKPSVVIKFHDGTERYNSFMPYLPDADEEAGEVFTIRQNAADRWKSYRSIVLRLTNTGTAPTGAGLSIELSDDLNTWQADTLLRADGRTRIIARIYGANDELAVNIKTNTLTQFTYRNELQAQFAPRMFPTVSYAPLNLYNLMRANSLATGVQDVYTREHWEQLIQALKTKHVSSTVLETGQVGHALPIAPIAGLLAPLALEATRKGIVSAPQTVPKMVSAGRHTLYAVRDVGDAARAYGHAAEASDIIDLSAWDTNKIPTPAATDRPTIAETVLDPATIMRSVTPAGSLTTGDLKKITGKLSKPEELQGAGQSEQQKAAQLRKKAMLAAMQPNFPRCANTVVISETQDITLEAAIGDITNKTGAKHGRVVTVVLSAQLPKGRSLEDYTHLTPAAPGLFDTDKGGLYVSSECRYDLDKPTPEVLAARLNTAAAVLYAVVNRAAPALSVMVESWGAQLFVDFHNWDTTFEGKSWYGAFDAALRGTPPTAVYAYTCSVLRTGTAYCYYENAVGGRYRKLAAVLGSKSGDGVFSTAFMAAFAQTPVLERDFHVVTTLNMIVPSAIGPIIQALSSEPFRSASNMTLPAELPNPNVWFSIGGVTDYYTWFRSSPTYSSLLVTANRLRKEALNALGAEWWGAKLDTTDYEWVNTWIDDWTAAATKPTRWRTSARAQASLAGALPADVIAKAKQAALTTTTSAPTGGFTEDDLAWAKGLEATISRGIATRKHPHPSDADDADTDPSPGVAALRALYSAFMKPIHTHVAEASVATTKARVNVAATQRSRFADRKSVV